MQYTTETPSLARARRSTKYTLARQLGVKYFPHSLELAPYAVLDMISETAAGQLTNPLTVDNGI